jgi:predicted glycoside hydrolase/deacetylase ChbG (UPF0249 family)
MLIVNADDFGRSPAETDAALAAHHKGKLSSVSAMVFMTDSARAAACAKQAGIVTGLHLNLSQAFSDAAVTPGLRRSHERVRDFLGLSRYALVAFHPMLVADFAACVRAQLAEFERLYGHAPPHIDGHQHMHLASNVLLQGLLPRGPRVRRSFSFLPHERGPLNRGWRAWCDRTLARRHPMTQHFFSLTLQLRGGGMERVGELAAQASVELMVHPVWTHERAYLDSAEFQALRARMS